jgi:hypothetical protein
MRSVFGPRRENVQEDVVNCIILRLLFTHVIIIKCLLLRCQIKEGKGKVKEHKKGEKMSRSTRVKTENTTGRKYLGDFGVDFKGRFVSVYVTKAYGEMDVNFIFFDIPTR